MALLTSTEFLVRFPEFENAGTALIDAKIAEVDLRLAGLEIWKTEDNRNLGIGYRVADSIALSPYGVNARLVNKDGSTTYGKQYDKLIAEMGSGAFCLG